MQRNGGTVLDAAAAALARDDAERYVVDEPRVLAPFLPTALRSADAAEGARQVVGPGDTVPWPRQAGWIEFRPNIAAILRRAIEDPLAREEVPAMVFGYTLVGDFVAHAETGDPDASTQGCAVALGPCVITPDDLDPQTAYVSVRVDGEEWAKGNLNGTARTLLLDVQIASRDDRLNAGEAFASGPFELERFDQRIWPGAEIEVEAEGIGVLRNRLGR